MLSTKVFSPIWVFTLIGLTRAVSVFGLTWATPSPAAALDVYKRQDLAFGVGHGVGPRAELTGVFDRRDVVDLAGFRHDHEGDRRRPGRFCGRVLFCAGLRFGLSLIHILGGSYFANKKSSALIAYRLEELEKKVDKHNSVIERTYSLEETQAVLEEKIKVANHRIDDLEKKA